MLHHDVLQLAETPTAERAPLYDYVVREITAFALKHAHPIDDIFTLLNNRREALLDAIHALNNIVTILAAKHSVSLDII